MSEPLGLKGPYEYFGQLPSYDHCWYDVADQILLHSRRPEGNAFYHTQYDTVRKNRTEQSNHNRYESPTEIC